MRIPGSVHFSISCVKIPTGVGPPGVLCYVIAERNTEGGLDFWMQEPGEVHWYGYTPNEAEREAAASLLATGACTGWPLLSYRAIARR